MKNSLVFVTIFMMFSSVFAQTEPLSPQVAHRLTLERIKGVGVIRGTNGRSDQLEIIATYNHVSCISDWYGANIAVNYNREDFTSQRFELFAMTPEGMQTCAGHQGRDIRLVTGFSFSTGLERRLVRLQKIVNLETMTFRDVFIEVRLNLENRTIQSFRILE